jgi:hypothetical protein
LFVSLRQISLINANGIDPQHPLSLPQFQKRSI